LIHNYRHTQACCADDILSIILYQKESADLTDVTLTSAKISLLNRLNRLFAEEELSKTFPKVRVGLYFRLWRISPKLAFKLTLYKLGIFGLFIKWYYPESYTGQTGGAAE
jgi:hypothetical protein